MAAPAARPRLRRNAPRRQVIPRKRFGQHFLHDRGVLRRIVEAIGPAPGDEIVEIGPGEGALTRPLLERAGRLTALEVDRDLAAALAREFPRERLAIIEADALKYDFGVQPRGIRLVGNLPYNISTPLLFHLADCAARVRDMHFMLQLEVVNRMVAKPSTPEYGRLSVMLQTRFAMTKLFRVAPGCFRPPPKVDSAVVRLLPLAPGSFPDFDQATLAALVRRAFSARRKTLRNALPLAPQDYASLEIDPGLRPENLSPADYVRIARRISGS
ncbi:MAG: 16S rRNA (adenine(1518)-N(6)/adenine(1519)-N(6))-dimethyltransferase RsmA [Betaproteobacteria bacterium]|nr:16S rRNA (adenine(1518)-N(6)/adenine(1519)-N(6))-dimethyltransferase RsmA [Betaproteobacteria bacterium]